MEKRRFVCAWCIFSGPLSSLNKNTEISFWQTIKIEWCVIFIFRMPIEMPKNGNFMEWAAAQSVVKQCVLFLTFCCMFSFACCVCAAHTMFVSYVESGCDDIMCTESNWEVCVLFIRMHKKKHFDYALVLTIILFFLNV